MQVNWLLLVLGVLVSVAYFGFIGGIAGALVGGGREDRSLPANAGVGFLGALVGGAAWSAISGRDFESGGVLAALAGSVAVLLVWTLVQRRIGAADHARRVTG
jgi:uncharacterized membrane protein YeaQ/YmgE (transglycosylase-associated protein family)